MHAGRPSFTSKTINEIKLSPGEHRRHIIPSHLLLAALAGHANAKIGTIDKELQNFIKNKMNDTPSEMNDTPSEMNDTPSEMNDTPSEMNDTPSEMNDTPSEMNDTPSESTVKCLEMVAQFIHSNQANLFLEDGGENSAIGFLAKDMFNLISKADKSYDDMAYTKELDFGLCCNVHEQIIAQGPKGFKFAMQHRIEVCNIIAKSVEIVIREGFDRYEKLWPEARSRIFDAMQNLELDLNKAEGMAKQNGEAIRLFCELQTIASGSGRDFWTAVSAILALPRN